VHPQERVVLRLLETSPATVVWWPVLASFALSTVTALFLSELGLVRGRTEAVASTALLVAIAVAGAVTTVVLGYRKMRARPPAHWEMEIETGLFRVRDLSSGTVLAEAPLAAVSVRRGQYSTEIGDYPVLSVQVNDALGFSVAVADTCIAWRAPGSREGLPRFFVEPQSWHALVDQLGMRDHLA
jgi:hypothetical protein